MDLFSSFSVDSISTRDRMQKWTNRSLVEGRGGMVVGTGVVSAAGIESIAKSGDAQTTSHQSQ